MANSGADHVYYDLPFAALYGQSLQGLERPLQLFVNLRLLQLATILLQCYQFLYSSWEHNRHVVFALKVSGILYSSSAIAKGDTRPPALLYYVRRTARTGQSHLWGLPPKPFRGLQGPGPPGLQARPPTTVKSQTRHGQKKDTHGQKQNVQHGEKISVLSEKSCQRSEKRCHTATHGQNQDTRSKKRSMVRKKLSTVKKKKVPGWSLRVLQFELHRWHLLFRAVGLAFGLRYFRWLSGSFVGFLLLLACGWFKTIRGSFKL